MQEMVGMQIGVFLANFRFEGFHTQHKMGVEWIDAGCDVALSAYGFLGLAQPLSH